MQHFSEISYHWNETCHLAPCTNSRTPVLELSLIWNRPFPDRPIPEFFNLERLLVEFMRGNEIRIYTCKVCFYRYPVGHCGHHRGLIATAAAVMVYLSNQHDVIAQWFILECCLVWCPCKILHSDFKLESNTFFPSDQTKVPNTFIIS